jgi:hypothetical protein
VEVDGWSGLNLTVLGRTRVGVKGNFGRIFAEMPENHRAGVRRPGGRKGRHRQEMEGVTSRLDSCLKRLAAERPKALCGMLVQVPCRVRHGASLKNGLCCKGLSAGCERNVAACGLQPRLPVACECNW